MTKKVTRACAHKIVIVRQSLADVRFAPIGNWKVDTPDRQLRATSRHADIEPHDFRSANAFADWMHDFNPGSRVSPAFQTLPGTSFVVDGAAARVTRR
jgi:hypothetical protein